MKHTGRTVAGVVFASGMLLLAGSALAEGRQDLAAQLNQQRYFDMPENARTIGMGGSSVVTSSDSSSVVGNPAGLGFMKDAEVSVTYQRDTISGNDPETYANTEFETDGGQALAAIPIVPTLDGTPRYGTLGFGWSGSKGEFDDSSNEETKGHGLHVAYGKDISDTMSVVYGVSILDKKYTDNNGSVAGAIKMDDEVRHSVGLQMKASKATTYGVSTHYGSGTYETEITDLNTGAVTSEADEDISSWGAEAGIGHQMGATLLTGSVDYTKYDSDSDSDMNAWGFRTGLEHAFTDWLKGRLGYRYVAAMDYDQGFGNDNSKYNGVSFGAGVKLAKNLFADYGADYRWVGDDSDWTHSVSLSVPFSMCAN